MAKRKLVSARMLKKGMKIDQTILNQAGQSMIQRGAFLDDFQIEYILSKNIGGVYIADDSKEETPADAVAVQAARQVERAIETNRVADRNKVTLSEHIKKRVGEGVQFLYSNTDSKDFADTTQKVTQELMKAVFSNDAVAVDIGILQVSDEYTFKHSVDVATMAMIIGKQYGLTQREIHDIGVAGLLHDMGKSKIPPEILNKPARLTEEEFAIMKQHSMLGYQILKAANEFNDSILLGVLQHHEKLNQTGYPMGISGDRIHKYAKIIAVADVYDALVTERSYKRQIPKGQALEMIMAMTGELDIKAMRSFLATIILYPVDSIVTLSNGEGARVLENCPENAMRPKVVGLQTGKIYDLANDLACASLIVL